MKHHVKSFWRRNAFNKLFWDCPFSSFHMCIILRPVFSIIYQKGTANLDIYNGTYLAAQQRAIVITMNYRVASFGFLFFGNDDIIGNAGLRDQELAMRFIQNNRQALRGKKGQVGDVKNLVEQYRAENCTKLLHITGDLKQCLSPDYHFWWSLNISSCEVKLVLICFRVRFFYCLIHCIHLYFKNFDQSVILFT